MMARSSSVVAMPLTVMAGHEGGSILEIVFIDSEFEKKKIVSETPWCRFLD